MRPNMLLHNYLHYLFYSPLNFEANPKAPTAAKTQIFISAFSKPLKQNKVLQ